MGIRGSDMRVNHSSNTPHPCRLRCVGHTWVPEGHGAGTPLHAERAKAQACRSQVDYTCTCLEGIFIIHGMLARVDDSSPSINDAGLRGAPWTFLHFGCGHVDVSPLRAYT